MMRERKMAMVVNKMSIAEAEEREFSQWQEVSFEEKWASLERMRKGFYSIHKLPFPKKIKKVIKKIKGWS